MGEQAMNRMKDAVDGLEEVHPNLPRMEMPTHAGPNQDQIKAAQEAAKAELDATLAGIQQQQELTKDQAKNFQITAEQELAIEQNLIGQKLAVETAYYDKLKALAAGKVSEVAKANAGEQKANDDANSAMLAATLRAADELRKAQLEAATETASETLAATVAGIKQQESALQELAKAHEVSYSQELAGERQLIGQELAARMAYYEQLKALAAGNVQQIAKLNQQEVQAAAT